MAEQTPGPWRSHKRARGYSSSSSAAVDDYDVFLNHRGPDVKGSFVAHLHGALTSAGLNPFLDKKSLAKGAPTSGSIDEALEVASVHVAVVSEGYAESKHCLSELVAMMRSGKPVIPVFYDMEPAHLRRVENGPFAEAFQKHKSRESAEQVEEWADALGKLADIDGFCFRSSDYKGDEEELKQEVVNAVLGLMPTHDDLQLDPHLVGLEEHMNTCANKLEQMCDGTGLLCIVGMGGVGKSTLAKTIYNHFVGEKKFQAMSYEIDRNPPSSIDVNGRSLLSGLQKQLLWDLLSVPENSQQRYKYWFHKLSRQGPVLIVLDDIHNKTQFDELILNRSLLAHGSCIIVTSCDRHVLNVVADGQPNYFLHEVTPLGCDDSQKLFNLHAFGNNEAPKNFKALANEVSKACGGLPLALKVVGSSLFDKRSDEDLECIWPEAVDALREDLDVTKALKWSYNCLTEPEKLMFVDIACVLHGWKKEEALEIWKGCKKCCGVKTPNTSLRQLIDKSLVVVEKNSRRPWYEIVMHGLLQDMGRSIGTVSGSHVWEDQALKVVRDKFQVGDKVRALNLTNTTKQKLEAEIFAKLTNLHYLILDGCDVGGDFGSISKKLQWLRWRNMPLTCLPSMLDLQNLVSLDFSKSTMLANLWAESDPALEACPNLLRLNLSECTSITTLPDSLGRLSRLQALNVMDCWNLQELPSSIGLLTALHELNISWCASLEALPDSITALSGLRALYLGYCSSMSKLPTSIGLMKSLANLNVDLSTKWQAGAIGQLNALKELGVYRCTDEAVIALDSSGALTNLDQLVALLLNECPAMTKLPETLGLLMNLDALELHKCEKVRELPKSIGQLKALTKLWLKKCSSLETLPDSLGALTSLQVLYIVKCTSITELPTSIGNLSGLLNLTIQGCGGLESLPDSLRQLNALVFFTITDCGSLEGLGALRMLQGLRMWGCTSVTELPGSCLMVVKSYFTNHSWYYDCHVEGFFPVLRNLKELRVVESNDCGFLRIVDDGTRLILQRVYKSPCCKLTTV